jgi:hypothetical protein
MNRRSHTAAKSREEVMGNPADARSSVPQTVRWGPSDGDPAGIRAFDSGESDYVFVPWSDLLPELERQLLRQLFADPRGYAFVLKDYHGKAEWLVQIVDARGEYYCDVWFGNDPENGWAFDGLVRVGVADEESPVWQAYERYSDGAYRRVQSRSATIDEMKR